MVTDNELLGLYAIKGDQLAFEQLIKRHAPMVMHVCQSFLWNKADCEDAFQSVFALLLRKSKSLTKHSSIGGWLHNVAINVSLTKRRSIRRQREVDFDYEPECPVPEPWESISNAQDCEKLHLEISRLPKHYREVIVLCHLNGNSRKQAAEYLETTTSSVKASLARAKKLLRQRLIHRGIGLSTVLSVSAAATKSVSAAQLPVTLDSAGNISVAATKTNIAQLFISKGSAALHIGMVQTSLAAAIGFVSLGAISIGLIASNTSIAKQHSLVVQQTETATVEDSVEVDIQPENSLPAQQSSPPLVAYRLMLEQQMQAAQERFGPSHPNIQKLQSQINELESLLALSNESGNEDESGNREQLARALRIHEHLLPAGIEDELPLLQRLQLELMDASGKYLPNHPKVVSLKSQIALLKKLRDQYEQQDKNAGYPETLYRHQSVWYQTQIAKLKAQLTAEEMNYGPEHPVVRAIKKQIQVVQEFANKQKSDANVESRKTTIMLNSKPIEKDAKYQKIEIDDIRVRPVRINDHHGYDAVNDAGDVLRRYIDTNGDKKIDIWVYFDNGRETYRDIDTDFDGKRNQSRFTESNTVRVGTDFDQDGKIDEWVETRTWKVDK